jgi:hypothetical protein
MVKGYFIAPYGSAHSLELDTGLEKFDKGPEIDFKDYWGWVLAA